MSLACQTLGDGPDLVLLHGWGMNSAVWSGFARRLADEWRLTLIDLPGHGESPYRGETELADWADACLGSAPERAVWLGWSLGAEIAIQAALQQTGRVTGLIVLAGTPRFVQGPDWRSATSPKVLETFRTATRADHRKTLERFLSLQLQGGDEVRETLRSLKQTLRERPEPSPEALEAGLGLLQQVDLRTALRQLDCPSLWLHGGRDTLVPKGVSSAIRELLPEAELGLIERAAHTPFLSHEAQTVSMINPFLERIHAQ
jgi:pimeloyl-[acyl-carrier protein] methyl ester esterase